MMMRGAAAILLEGGDLLHVGDGARRPAGDDAAGAVAAHALASARILALAAIAVGAQPLLDDEVRRLADEGEPAAPVADRGARSVPVDEDVERTGAAAKASPPRRRHERQPAQARGRQRRQQERQREAAQRAAAEAPGSPPSRPARPPTQAETPSTFDRQAHDPPDGPSRPNG